MKRLTILTMAIIAAVTLNSCRNDFDFEKAYYYYNDRLSSYADTFTDVYGEIEKDQTWDFASPEKKTVTRATGQERIYIDTDNSHAKTFSSNLRLAVANALEENKWQLENFKPFVIIYDGPFNIYPLWHGQCNKWDLKVVGASGSISFNQISGDMGDNAHTDNSMSKTNLSNLTTKGYRIEGFEIGEPIILYLEVTSANSSDYAKKGDIIPTAFGDAKIKIECTSKKKDSWAYKFYKKDKNDLYKTHGALKLPLDHQQLKNQTTYYSKIGEEIKKFQAENGYMIMFEDANQWMTDMDFNDVIFYTNAPTSTYDEYTYASTCEKTEKRYMIEDLGSTSTSDIDFNDIVVDLFQTKTIWTKWKITKSETGTELVKVQVPMTEDDKIKYPDKTEQSAKIRALGGTIDLALKINGNSFWRKSEAGFDVHTMFNTGWKTGDREIGSGDIDYENVYAEFDVTGWNPSTNNISVEVYARDETYPYGGDTEYEGGSSEMDGDTDYSGKTYEKYEIKFPEQGKVPCMIAFDVTKKWRLERDGITKQETQQGTEYYWFGNDKY